MNGKLYLIPTPIGNLEDITYRAVRILKEADTLLAEDTRHAARLLKHLGIDRKTHAHHQHNEHKALKGVIHLLQEGQQVALVSDAGTPGISDPGFLLVRECIREGIAVETLPGATAFVPALVNSGLPCDKFCFEGFLPVKKGRQTRLQALSGENRTMAFYESPHRLLKTLDEFIAVFGAVRQASVSRELTKVFEETVRGSLEELKTYFENNALKGEFVICVAGERYEEK
ncbi:16S rRNA (cytidine1402-2'-O)-methyltransferase [Anseongella ginsenosidimutans]|uniref:Ribosomal RNA small subunit methyltransferase I n=1 Tax=Anseongella ginsenosidimutans TaxID=496056 RepID=A0A4R3KXK2_9SPHI|nr:16S rRNA (cytidine(1402)-2'-O)-methyltransferase [Anseongella ginsenosidimutans]QEC51196.1 16S rRNA (cytidine(1402)-2'-O)-methyltransferase [Anseongella ginsenosidimutans]TCS90131.1 16S rRNA (cytidine1402-2'-O)-methyltransferase [Anseongella ginsenosidimutans]